MVDDAHADGRARGISLWLVPEPPAARRLAALIESLSRPLGAPVFEPHVTLLGGLDGREDDVIEHAGVVARAASPIKIELREASHCDEFFRCVVLEAAQARELMELETRARRELTREGGPPFQPHLSLVYGRFPSGTRERACAAATATLPERLDVRRLEAWRTDGFSREWRRLAAFDLGVG